MSCRNAIAATEALFNEAVWRGVRFRQTSVAGVIDGLKRSTHSWPFKSQSQKAALEFDEYDEPEFADYIAAKLKG